MRKDLRQFLWVVEQAGSNFYTEVKKPLKPKLEPFILQQKLLREGRTPVIYCPQIEGSNLPLVTGLLGSYELLGMALDMKPEQVDKAEISQEFRRRVAKAMPVKVLSATETPV